MVDILAAQICFGIPRLFDFIRGPGVVTDV